MVLMLVIGLSLTAMSGVLALRAFGVAHAERRRTLNQIGSYGFRSTAPVAEHGDLRTAVGELATRAGERAMRQFERLRAEEGTLRKLLNSAGLYQTPTTAFVGARILLALAGPGLLALFTLTGRAGTQVVLGCLLLTGMGWYMPSVAVQRRARLRIERIDREVPELVDLLVTTVESGVGFGAALQLASRSIEGPLGQELRLALREQSLGLTPEEALRNLSARVESPAARAFTQALVQGESLGVSIGTIMRDLAIDMRKRRRQQAEERAQKAPLKLLFPLIALILPAMFIVVLGPAILDIIRFLGS